MSSKERFPRGVGISGDSCNLIRSGDSNLTPSMTEVWFVQLILSQVHFPESMMIQTSGFL